MNLNTTIFRRHSTPIVVVLLFSTVFIITVYKFQNEGFEFYNEVYNSKNNSAPEVIERLTSILEGMIEKAVKNITIPKREGCVIPPLKNIFDFFDYGKKEKFKCKHLVEIGGSSKKSMKKDGSKYVCLDDIVPGNCNVLSFGISNEWSFDDAIYKLGCVVYAFDPTMGREDHDRTPGIHFFNLGLSDFSGMTKIGGKTCKVETYANILKKLNLTGKKIDYLKMDIEGSEINFFRDVFINYPHLLDNVKQLGVEIHPGMTSLSTIWPNTKMNNFNIFWTIMHRLECQGFKLMHYEANRVKSNHYQIGNRTESGCYEIVWINK
ncbi:UNVERIFIED_CONTAM: hypothetical protein RMT77_001507 [Armadillidium vulgare]